MARLCFSKVPLIQMLTLFGIGVAKVTVTSNFSSVTGRYII